MRNDAKSYRTSMSITECWQHGNELYYICPRCGVFLIRDFISYCDNCGQHLGWEKYRHAKIIYCAK